MPANKKLRKRTPLSPSAVEAPQTGIGKGRSRGLLALLLLALAPPLLGAAPTQAAPTPDSPTPAPGSPVITLAVDATDAPRKIMHVRETFPVKPGPLTLYYPKWIPGEHRPSGPLVNLAGPTLSAGGRPLAWRRDLVDLYAFHCTVPPGTRTLDAAFDFLDVANNGGTPNLAVLDWNEVLLYPAGRTADGWTFDASLKLPDGWKFGTALPVAGQTGQTVQFLPAPLITLVDSPVSCGRYAKVIALDPPGTSPSQEVDMVGDSPAAIDMSPEMVQDCRQLVAEAYALFGARHYRDYHWLLTLSDQTPGNGVEHHESSNDVTRERALSTPQGRAGVGGLLAHEYTHSWNGKYRRPYDLYTTDYQKPMQDDLLWVYEGMTQYWGIILNERAGFERPEATRDSLAATAAGLDHRPGRSWRSLQDTADSSSFIRGTGREYDNLRRAQDYYSEGALIWLEADTLIRQQTGGRKSLDDFCRAFFGPPSTGPEVRTYTFDDVVRTLSAVTPYDWAGFLHARLDATGGGAPLGGITNSGWKLVYTDTPGQAVRPTDAPARPGRTTGGAADATARPGRGPDAAAPARPADFRYSLGLSLDTDGVITDINPTMPAFQSGLGPGIKVVAVGDQAYTPEVLRAALKAAVTDPQPMTLLTAYGTTYHAYAVDYHGGDRYPHLERDPSKPDLLTAIFQPKAAPAR